MKADLALELARHLIAAFMVFWGLFCIWKFEVLHHEDLQAAHSWLFGAVVAGMWTIIEFYEQLLGLRKDVQAIKEKKTWHTSLGD